MATRAGEEAIPPTHDRSHHLPLAQILCISSPVLVCMCAILQSNPRNEHARLPDQALALRFFSWVGMKLFSAVLLTQFLC